MDFDRDTDLREVISGEFRRHPFIYGLRKLAKEATHEGPPVQLIVSESEYRLLKEMGIEGSGRLGIAATVSALCDAAISGLAAGRLARFGRARFWLRGVLPGGKRT